MTKVFTYEVKLTVHVISDTEENAMQALEQSQSGVVSNREIELLKVTEVDLDSDVIVPLEN